MKDFTPSAVMQSATAGELTTANALKTGQQGAETVFSGGFSAGLLNDRGSFLASLESLLPAGNTQPDAAANTPGGGKPLPLAVSAANSGQVDPLASAGDQAVPVAELTVASQIPLQQAEAAAELPDLPELIARTPPFALVTTAGALKTPGIPGVAEQPAVARAEQAPAGAGAGVVMPADASIARLQRVLPEMAQSRDAARVERLPVHNSGEAADAQVHALKAETQTGETVQPLMSRLQLAAVTQTAELSAQKHALETLTNTVQASAPEALRPSVSHAPMQQPAVLADPLSSSAQSMITEQLGRPEWGQGMGKQILWMVNQNLGRAEIRLNPANLGPMEVRIDLDNDQVSVAFTSRHAEVRDAVEQALPRLREMLEEKGLSLADTDISRHSFAEQRQAYGDTGSDNNRADPVLASARGSDQQAESGGMDRRSVWRAGAAGDGMVDYYI